VSVKAQAPLMRNIATEILHPAGSLFNEVPLLLHEELKGEVDVFSRVLEALASGAHQRRDVARAIQGTLASAQHYLDALHTIGVVEHRRPLTRLRQPHRQGTYHIVDPFLRFWHRWVAPSHRLLAIQQRQAETLSEIRQHLPYIVAPVWEDMARASLLLASGQGRLPFPVQDIGSWWSARAQVDVVGVNRHTRQVLFGEARWRATHVTNKDVEDLIEKGLLWLEGDTARWDVHYAFFAKAFGRIQVDESEAENVHLFTPADLTTLADTS
jgi:uncharacterized protein